MICSFSHIRASNGGIEQNRPQDQTELEGVYEEINEIFKEGKTSLPEFTVGPVEFSTAVASLRPVGTASSDDDDSNAEVDYDIDYNNCAAYGVRSTQPEIKYTNCAAYNVASTKHPAALIDCTDCAAYGVSEMVC